ncbi:MAG: PIN domain-containing protein [Desulfuromonadales bacterium]|nr:PIN domain-containing protein [Desulfuromonadales bacterium]
MKVLVDTSVWSLALRRNRPSPDGFVRELVELIEEQRVVMIGSVRQELLSGIRSPAQFERLREHLRAFPDFVTDPADFERAAEFFTLCRGKGIQGANTDFLICAIAANHHLAILTSDCDFSLYAEHLPILLHRCREEGLVAQEK